MKNTRIYISDDFLSEDTIEAIFRSHGDPIDSEMAGRIHESLNGRDVVAVGGDDHIFGKHSWEEDYNPLFRFYQVLAEDYSFELIPVKTLQPGPVPPELSVLETPYAGLVGLVASFVAENGKEESTFVDPLGAGATSLKLKTFCLDGFRACKVLGYDHGHPVDLELAFCGSLDHAIHFASSCHNANAAGSGITRIYTSPFWRLHPDMIRDRLAEQKISVSDQEIEAFGTAIGWSDPVIAGPCAEEHETSLSRSFKAWKSGKAVVIPCHEGEDPRSPEGLEAYSVRQAPGDSIWFGLEPEKVVELVRRHGGAISVDKSTPSIIDRDSRRFLSLRFEIDGFSAYGLISASGKDIGIAATPEPREGAWWDGPEKANTTSGKRSFGM